MTAPTAARPVGAPRGGLLRIGGGLTLLQVTVFSARYAATNILLPVQIIATAGEAGKETWLGIVIFLGSAVSLVVGPVVGGRSDRTRTRFGRRAPWVLGGTALFAAGLLVTGCPLGIVAVLVGWTLVQAGIAAVTTVSGTVVPERVPVERRGTIGGVIGVVTVAAVLTSGFLGAAFQGTPWLGFAVLGVIAVGGGLLFVLLVPERDGRGGPAAPADVAAATTPAGPRSRRASLLRSVSAFGSRDVRWVWYSSFLLSLGYQLLVTRQLFFLQSHFDLGVADASAAAARVTAATGALTVVGLVVSGPLSDRLGRRPFVVLGGLFTALGLLLVLRVDTLPQFIGAYAVVMLAFGVFSGVSSALIADVLPRGGDVGRDLGLMNLSPMLSQTLAPMVGTVVLLVTGGSYQVLIVVGAACSLAAAVAATRIRGVR